MSTTEATLFMKWTSGNLKIGNADLTAKTRDVDVHETLVSYCGEANISTNYMKALVVLVKKSLLLIVLNLQLPQRFKVIRLLSRTAMVITELGELNLRSSVKQMQLIFK